MHSLCWIIESSLDIFALHFGRIEMNTSVVSHQIKTYVIIIAVWVLLSLSFLLCHTHAHIHCLQFLLYWKLLTWNISLVSDIGLGSEMFYRYVYPYSFCIFGDFFFWLGGRENKTRMFEFVWGLIIKGQVILSVFHILSWASPVHSFTIAQ